MQLSSLSSDSLHHSCPIISSLHLFPEKLEYITLCLLDSNYSRQKQKIDFDDLEKLFFLEFPEILSNSNTTKETYSPLALEIINQTSMERVINLLWWIMTSTSPKIDLVCALLIFFSHSLDPNINNKKDPPLLFLTYDFCHLYGVTEPLEILLTYPEIDINIIDSYYESSLLHISPDQLNPDLVDILLQSPKIELHHINLYNNTPLTHLISLSTTEENNQKRQIIIEKFLAHPKVDINRMNSLGPTALHSTIEMNDFKNLKLLLLMPQIQLNEFISFPSSAYSPFSWNITLSPPLSYASNYGRKEIVQLLLAHPGIDVNIRDQDRYSAIYTAIKFNCYNMINILMDFPGIVIQEKELNLAIKKLLEVNSNREVWEPLVASLRQKTSVPSKSISSAFSYIHEKFQEDDSWADSFALAQELRIAPTFALIVYLCDDYLRLKDSSEITTESMKDFRRFFTIAIALPMELQMVLSHRCFASAKNNISSKDSEKAFSSQAHTFI